MQPWYYVAGGQRLGPVSPDEFERLVRQGVIGPDTLVWRAGMAEWQPQATAGSPRDAGENPAAEGEPTEVCAVSGQRYPRRAMIQYEGKWISAEHRDTFFQRMREGVIQPGQFKFGNFWPRFGAKFIDGLALGVGGVLVNMVLAAFIYGSANYFRPNPVAITPARLILFQGLSFVLGLAMGLSYAIFFIRRYDATPGKMALGLKLMRTDGSKLSIGRIVGRHFAEWISAAILLMGYVMAAFDEERRTLHDRICDTRVVVAK